jgi:hypothetical protein
LYTEKYLPGCQQHGRNEQTTAAAMKLAKHGTERTGDFDERSSDRNRW